ncbi:MAG: mechanosensitive ion channel family protein [Deltaproteobacteria bacterium]|nr:mechanosensitive ion channel family protein [Deltaproteobacteria bacterium]
MLKRPFEIGDRIEIKGQSGDVIDIQVFPFSMLKVGNRVDADQSTGRIVHVPNGLVFNQIISNYSKGLPFLWNEIPVLVTFDIDWQKAKEILSEIVLKNMKDQRQKAEQKLKQE